MTWRERTVCMILLMVAQIVAKDPTLRAEIQKVSNHVSVHGSQADAE